MAFYTEFLSAKCIYSRDVFWKKIFIKTEIFNDKQDFEEVVYHQGLFYNLEIIKIELTSHFGIEKLSKTYY